MSCQCRGEMPAARICERDCQRASNCPTAGYHLIVLGAGHRAAQLERYRAIGAVGEPAVNVECADSVARRDNASAILDLSWDRTASGDNCAAAADLPPRISTY